MYTNFKFLAGFVLILLSQSLLAQTLQLKEMCNQKRMAGPWQELPLPSKTVAVKHLQMKMEILK